MWGKDVDLYDWERHDIQCEDCGATFFGCERVNFCFGGVTVRVPTEESKCLLCRNRDLVACKSFVQIYKCRIVTCASLIVSRLGV